MSLIDLIALAAAAPQAPVEIAQPAQRQPMCVVQRTFTPAGKVPFGPHINCHGSARASAPPPVDLSQNRDAPAERRDDPS